MSLTKAESVKGETGLARYSLKPGLDRAAAQEIARLASDLGADKETRAVFLDLSALASMSHDGLLALLHLARACHKAEIPLSLLCSPVMETLLRHLSFDGLLTLERPLRGERPPPPAQL